MRRCSRGSPLQLATWSARGCRRCAPISRLRRAALLSSLGAQPRSTYFRLLQLDEYLGGLVEDFVVGLVGLRDQSFADLLDEGLAPTTVTPETLNTTFAAAPNNQLAFQCAADWIDADLGMRAPPAPGADSPCDNAPRTRTTVDPARFAALDDALTLARLALLDQQGRAGGHRALRRQSGRAAHGRAAALFGAAGQRPLAGRQPSVARYIHALPPPPALPHGA